MSCMHADVNLFLLYTIALDCVTDRLTTSNVCQCLTTVCLTSRWTPNASARTDNSKS